MLLGRGQGREREDGAAAVEFALVLPLLVMLLLGIATTGLSYSNAIGVTNAVREGARFGATANATSSSWSTDVISRVRATQFDDPSTATEICVQLWKKTSATDGVVVPGRQACEGNVPGVALPTTQAAPPAVPAGLPVGACVVRIVAGRPFTINIVLKSWEHVSASTAVARYERMDDDAVSGCL